MNIIRKLISSSKMQPTKQLLPGLECKDTIGLKSFLESNYPAMFLRTEDPAFDTARLSVIFIKTAQFGFIDFKEFLDVLNNDDEKPASKTKKDLKLIVVVHCADADFKDDDLDKINNIIKKAKGIKIIFLHQTNINLPGIFKGLKFQCKEAAFKPFELNELTEKCIAKLLERKMIIFMDKKMNFKDFLMTDSDGVLGLLKRSKFTKDVKDLVTTENFKVSIGNGIQRLIDLDVLFLEANIEAHSSKLVNLLNLGSQIVLSGDFDDKLSEKLSELGAIVTKVDGEETFRKECQMNPGQTVYWLEAADGRLILKKVYDQSFYLNRRFHHVMKINLEQLIETNSSDVFIIENVEDGELLQEELGLSQRLWKMFKNNVDYYTEESVDDSVLSSGRPVHYLKLEKTIDGKGQLIWKRSTRDLHRVRSFVNPDVNQSVDERELCQTERRITIIADEPGMGKTTSLTSMTRFIRDHWTIRIDLKNLQNELDNLTTPISISSAIQFLIKSEGSIEFCLLQRCLEPNSKRKVILLMDGFDEIRIYGADDSRRSKVLNLCKFLIKQTSANVIITTRLFPQDYLENELMEFATVFKKISEEDQQEYLVHIWTSLLEVQRRESGEEERLKELANKLYKDAEKILGHDVKQFMGIPLQMRMLAETFFAQIIKTSMIDGFFEIETVVDFYDRFIQTKYDIYFDSKIDPIHDYDKEALREVSFQKHRILGMQVLDYEYARQNVKVYDPADPEDLKALVELNRFGIIQLHQGNTTFDFIHRTFAEYFFAELVVEWMGQDNYQYRHMPLENFVLSQILLQPDYRVVRLFIDAHLQKKGISADGRKRFESLLCQMELNKIPEFKDSFGRTALHLAVEENNKYIIDAFMSSYADTITQNESYISFLATRDYEGRTAMFIALDVKNRKEIRKTMLHFIDLCSKELKEQQLYGTCLGKKTVSEETQSERFFWNANFNVQTIFLSDTRMREVSEETENIFKRLKELVGVVVNSFVSEVKKCSEKEIIEMFNKLVNLNERYYLPLAMNSEGETAINIAAERGFFNVVELFANEDVNKSTGRYDLTPLHCASRSLSGYEPEHLKVIEFFLLRGVNVNCRESHGRTPLILAALSGNTKIVKYLITKSADVNARDCDGSTALIMAAMKGHVNVINVLLDNNADVKAREKSGRTALFFSAEEGNLEAVKILHNHLGKSIEDINVKNNKNETILSQAAKNGHCSVVEELLNYTEDVQFKDKTGLICAIIAMHLNVVKILLNKGADPNAVDSAGSSMIILAANAGFSEAIQELLNYGADVDSSDANGMTAYLCATQNGNKAAVEILLNNGVDINSVDALGRSALGLAARDNKIEMMKLLLEKGIDANARDSSGRCALSWAADRGHRDAVMLLLDHGADVNSSDAGERNPLGWAAEGGHIEVAKYLLNSGAVFSSSATSLAKSEGHTKLANLFEEFDKYKTTARIHI